MGAFIRGLREIFRDHTRDEFCESLRALGVPAELAPRGAAEERGFRGTSLGLVSISAEPIRWVNVRTESWGDDYRYFTDYAVPDPRLRSRDTTRLNVECTTTGGPWPFHDLMGVRWRGDDLGLGLVRRLDADESLRRPLLERVFPTRWLRIQAPSRRGFWTITVPGGDTGLVSTTVSRPNLDIPSSDQWRCYLAIAQHLLDSPLLPSPR